MRKNLILCAAVVALTGCVKAPKPEDPKTMTTVDGRRDRAHLEQVASYGSIEVLGWQDPRSGCWWLTTVDTRESGQPVSAPRVGVPCEQR